MTTVNSANQSTAAALAVANANSQDLMGQTQDRFLTLLVTQLRNQDPLNPMDNAQVTSQIAQLSTVNGINQLNNTLLALSGQMDVSQSMQAANLIGRDVLVPGAKVSLGSDPANPSLKESTLFGVDVISAAAKVTAVILDGAGKVVRTFDLGKQDPSVLTLDWDGKDDGGAVAPDGAYSVQVSASDADGVPVTVQALTSGKVASVAYSSQGLQLDLGLAGKHHLLDIRKIM